MTALATTQDIAAAWFLIGALIPTGIIVIWWALREARDERSAREADATVRDWHPSQVADMDVSLAIAAHGAAACDRVASVSRIPAQRTGGAL